MTEKTQDGWVEIEIPEGTPPTEDTSHTAVEVVQEEPAAPVVSETPEPTPPPPEETPKADDEQALAKKRERAETRIRALSTKLREAERSKQEREAALLAEIEALRKQSHETQKAVVTTAKQALETQVKSAEEALVKAYNEADPAAIAQATRALSQASVALERAELEATALPAEPQKRQQEQRSNAQPEALEAWVKENPWFVQGPQQDQRASLMAAKIGDELVNEGYDLADPGLYEELDRRLQEELPRLRKKPVVATPSRAAAPTASSRRPGVVRLSPEEVELAKFFGMTPQEWAKEKVKQGNAENGYTAIGDEQ